MTHFSFTLVVTFRAFVSVISSTLSAGKPCHCAYSHTEDVLSLKLAMYTYEVLSDAYGRVVFVPTRYVESSGSFTSTDIIILRLLSGVRRLLTCFADMSE